LEHTFWKEYYESDIIPDLVESKAKKRSLEFLILFICLLKKLGPDEIIQSMAVELLIPGRFWR